jgi:hypothetical protein
MEKAFNCATQKKRLPPPLRASSLGLPSGLAGRPFSSPTNHGLTDILLVGLPSLIAVRMVPALQLSIDSEREGLR